jgi:hypothetical protein
MKHALFAPFALLVLLAGCAAEQETGGIYQFAVTPKSALPVAQTAAAGSPPTREAKLQPREAPEATREQSLRNERLVYAQGLEKILLSNGVNVSVAVYEGKADPTPTLMFVGHFSREFVERAVTSGAVLQRAKELGFKSVDFFDRGPDGHYQFVLSTTAPLPKCAAYNRLCL